MRLVSNHTKGTRLKVIFNMLLLKVLSSAPIQKLQYRASKKRLHSHSTIALMSLYGNENTRYQQKLSPSHRPDVLAMPQGQKREKE